MFDEIDFNMNDGASIKVAGIGGGGSNVVNMLLEYGLDGVDFMIFNTDSQALINNNAKTKVQIGEKLTKGLGAGANPEMGYKCMLQDIEKIEDLVEDTDLIFVISCLGGGTGSGACIPFLEMCKKKGILTVCIVTEPFTFEGKRRKSIAHQSLEHIKKAADSTVMLCNDNLLKMAEKNISLKNSFKFVDDYLSDNIKSIISLINEPGMINLDFADITTILKNSKTGVFCTGVASGSGRAKLALENALNSPLLDRDITKASRVLLNIKGPEDLSLFEVNTIAQYIAEQVHEDANIIFGASSNGNKDDHLKISVLVSGFDD